MSEFHSATAKLSDNGLDELPNSQLWQRVVNNDQAAFESVVQRYQNRVSAVAYSRTGNFSWAQEITQETFWQAWRGRAELQDPDHLGAWLAGIARNLSLQLIKREQRQSSSDLTMEWTSDAEDPAFVNVSREESEVVWSALRELPENYREPLVLFYREEHSISDVAEVLSLSEDAVKQRLSRGRNLLRERLASRVEEVLVRSRPNRILTTRIMAGVAALATSMKATGSVAAATTATGTTAAAAIGKHVAGSVATKGLLASPLAGGLLGVAGGLGGAWLGVWIPAQMAETVAQRELMERRGKQTFLAGIIFSLVLLAASGLLLISISPLWFAAVTAIASLCFVVFVITHTVTTNSLIQKLKLNDRSPINPSKFKKRFEGLQEKQGRSFTSRFRLLGLPLLDIQLGSQTDYKLQETKKAFGWIAIGDQATGVIAFGGVARGILALGGVAIGMFAFGGLAIGGLAMGGAAAGLLALGGGAVGYHAVGGGAVGIRSAVGGGAFAYHVAVGGGAFAVEHSVTGGDPRTETNPSWVVAQQDSFVGLMELISSPYSIAIIVILAGILPILLAILVRRLPDKRSEMDAAEEHF